MHHVLDGRHGLKLLAAPCAHHPRSIRGARAPARCTSPLLVPAVSGIDIAGTPAYPLQYYEGGPSNVPHAVQGYELDDVFATTQHDLSADKWGAAEMYQFPNHVQDFSSVLMPYFGSYTGF